MFLSSFWSNPLIWVLVSLLSLLVPCIYFFISLFKAFTSSSILVTILNHFCEHLITSVLNSASDRLSMSLSLSSFSGFLSVLSFGPHFFVSMHLLYCKGWRLRYSPGQGNPPCWVVSLYVGRGQRGNNAACSALTPLLVTSPTTHKQIGPFCCWFPYGWACVCPRTLWVSQRNSPMRGLEFLLPPSLILKFYIVTYRELLLPFHNLEIKSYIY